jgi:hypothetical protein
MTEHKNIDLNRNNTNFPLQLLEYFHTNKWGDEYSFLKYYQNMVRIYVNDVNVGSRGLLIQHQMGLGKSILAIAIAMDMIKIRQPILLLSKSLQSNMRAAIHKYVVLRAKTDPDFALAGLDTAALTEWIDTHFSFVSMNASNMLGQMGRAAESGTAEEFEVSLDKKFGEVLKLTSLNGKLLIVDEAHNLFRAITNGSKNAMGVYDMVMKSRNLKVIFLTGTPITNNPFEVVPCFNMLGSNIGEIILPENYKDFNKLYVDTTSGKVKNKGKFQNRIFGLVSYVSHNSDPGRAFGVTESATKAEFPLEKPLIVVKVNMDPAQYVTYQLARDKEKDEGSGQFGISEPPSMTKPKNRSATSYRVRSRQLSNYCPPTGLLDEKDPNAIPITQLASPKFTTIVENIDKHQNQIGIVYSQFIGVGGLGTFQRYLDTLGWSKYGSVTKPTTGVFEYVVENNTKENSTEKGIDSFIEGGGASTSAIPPVDEYFEYINRELNQSNTLWANSIYGSSDSSTPTPLDGVKIRYATVNDTNLLLRADSEYVYKPQNFKYPRYVLLITHGKLVGYAIIEFYTSTGVNASHCSGEIVRMRVDQLNGVGIRESLEKLLKDIIECHNDIETFKMRKPFHGGVEISLHNRPDAPRKYAVISGEVDMATRKSIEDVYNLVDNKYGGILDLILLSSTGAEGLDFKNVRHIHIMEPYWNWSRVAQIIARGVRNDSHILLEQNERDVQPYIYLAIPPATEKNAVGEFASTTDVDLYTESVQGQVVIESFLEAIREVSIECLANDESYCRKCAPTDQPLFTDNPERDIRSRDPCTTLEESKVIATSIEVNGTTYYYKHDSSSIYDYKVYKLDPKIAGYRQLLESSEEFKQVIAVLLTPEN